MLKIKILSIIIAVALLSAESLRADTLELKNGKVLKGLVVERHEDRIVLSAESGEIPILLKGIKNIQYNDPALSFYEMGRSYEAQSKWSEALAYYEKALELNPELQQAGKAASGVRSRFMAMQTEGPRNEMEKQQILQEVWSQGKTFSSGSGESKASITRLLRERLGLSLTKKGDWVIVDFVQTGQAASLCGIKKNDRCVSIDGVSTRYLGADAVALKMLEPRRASFELEYERDVFFKEQDRRLKNLGFGLKLENRGVVVHKIKSGGIAESLGLKEGDLIMSVNQVMTRYMPIQKCIKNIESSIADRLVLTIRRGALLSRG